MNQWTAFDAARKFLLDFLGDKYTPNTEFEWKLASWLRKESWKYHQRALKLWKNKHRGVDFLELPESIEDELEEEEVG